MFKCSKCKKDIEKTGYCKICQRIYSKEYYQKNSDKVKQYQKQYNLQNSKKVKEVKRKWEQSNPESKKRRDEKYYPQKLIRNLLRQRRLRELKCDWNFNDWELLKQLYKNKCLRCKKTDVLLTPDHIIPIYKGGSNLIENIQPLCKSCNSQKYLDTTDYRNKHD